MGRTWKWTDKIVLILIIGLILVSCKVWEMGGIEKILIFGFILVILNLWIIVDKLDDILRALSQRKDSFE